jgi:hypothetical protein
MIILPKFGAGASNEREGLVQMVSMFSGNLQINRDHTENAAPKKIQPFYERFREIYEKPVKPLVF